MDGREVRSLWRLMEAGKEEVLAIAERLERDCFLDEEALLRFSRLRVELPWGPGLADFDSWELVRR